MDHFQMSSEGYEKEQDKLRAKIAMSEEEIQNQQDLVEKVDRFIQVQRAQNSRCGHQLQLYRHTPRQFTL